MRRTAAGLTLLLFAAPLGAAPPTIDIPAEISPAGQYVVFTPDTDAVAVVYVGLSGLEPMPAAVLKNPTQFVMDCYGKPAGCYRFAAVAASATGEQARADFVLVIGDAPAPPQPPGPGPGPQPDDPLTAEVRQLYEADPLPPAERAKAAESLAALYRQAAALITDSVRCPNVGTFRDVVTRAAVDLGLGGPQDKLAGVRALVSRELSGYLPAAAANPIPADGRARAAEYMRAVAEALDTVRVD